MLNSTSKGSLSDVFAGVLLGTAVGDSLGLPVENMSPRRIHRLRKGEWKHRFFLGRGLVSDDTEHALFVAQALLAQPNNANSFQKCLAWKLRAWLLGLPAGIGWATLRAVIRLWLGFHPNKSGVFSAGNGPAMRSAILGAYFAFEPEMLRSFVAASTRITHTDPKAEVGALAVARAVAWTIQYGHRSDRVENLLDLLKREPVDEEWLAILNQFQSAWQAGRSVADFAHELGLQNGVTGYIYHTVPVAIFASLRHGEDFVGGLQAALDCGGDTDTVGAVTGAIMGSTVGKSGIPSELRSGIVEWPRSCQLLERVAERLSEQKIKGQILGPVQYFWPALVVRNLFFVVIVLLHGLRRLAPPY